MKRNIVIGSLVVVLSACGGGGGDSSTGSPVIGGETQLSAPELEDRSSKVLKIKWDYVSGTDKYKLFRNEQLIYTGSSNYYSDSVDNGLQQNVPYTYKFSHVDSSGKESSVSKTSPAFYLLNDATVLPSAPSSVEWTKRWKDKIEIKWYDNADNEEGFEVYEGAQKVGETQFGTEKLEISGLSPDTEYSFTVKAKNAEGLSQPSPVSKISTLSVKVAKAVTVSKIETQQDTVIFTYSLVPSSTLEDPNFITIILWKEGEDDGSQYFCLSHEGCVISNLTRTKKYEYAIATGNWKYEENLNIPGLPFTSNQPNYDTYSPKFVTPVAVVGEFTTK